MAAHSLREAILNGLTAKKIFPTEEQVLRLEGELRDFFAHEVMKAAGPIPSISSSKNVMEWKIREVHLTAFFHNIFKDVSSYQGKKDE
jgi:hypothetical protein